jgi:hypothetical protein
MISIDIKADLSPIVSTLARVGAALTPQALDPVVERVALRALREVVDATPKKWFGQVRRSWQLEKPELGARLVKNDNKIMLFLEEGTRAHGPKGSTVAASGFSASGPQFKVHGNRSGGGFTHQGPVKPKTSRLYIPLTRRAAFGWRPGLKYGRDYILVPWVRGIQARHIAAKQAQKSNDALELAIIDHLEKALK